MVISLDGFATSVDGTHEWMFEWFGDDSSERNLCALEDAGVHVMGRRSYEIMGPHWAASEGPIATAMNEKPKAVFSHTLKKAEWGPADGTVLVHGGPDFAIRRAGRAPEAGRRRRGTLPERSPRADSGAEAMSDRRN